VDCKTSGTCISSITQRHQCPTGPGHKPNAPASPPLWDLLLNRVHRIIPHGTSNTFQCTCIPLTAQSPARRGGIWWTRDLEMAAMEMSLPTARPSCSFPPPLCFFASITYTAVRFLCLTNAKHLHFIKPFSH